VIGERRRRAAHRWLRIWPGKLADGAESNVKFRQLRWSSREGRKEGEGGVQGAFIGGLGVGRGLGLGLDCIGRLGDIVQERDGVQGRKEAPTGGVHLSAGGGDGVFCKFHSNQFKQSSKLFKHLLQRFKLVRNMLSKQNMILGKSLCLSKVALLT
jgi:hypothetical protein